MFIERRLPVLSLMLGVALAAAGCQKSKGGGGQGLLTALQILPTNPTIEMGFTPQQIGVQARYDNGAAEWLDPASATWALTDAVVPTNPCDAATVENGLLVGKAQGACKLTASYKGLSVSTDVKVLQLVGLQVVPTNADVAVKLKKTLHAIALYADHTTKDVTAEATWSIHDPGLAGLSSGVATGLAAGSTRVSASYHGRDASTAFTVSPRVLNGVAISGGPTALAQLTTATLKATATFDDATTLDVTKLATWTSSDDKIATVDGSGTVTPVKEGTATISAKFSQGATSSWGTQAVVVKADTVVVTGIAVTPASATIPLGVTTKFVATATFSDASTQDVTKDVAWTTKNATGDAVSHAAVSEGTASTTRTQTSPVFEAGTTAVVAAFTLADGKTEVKGQSDLTVTAGTLQSIELTPAAPTIAVGAQASLTATGHYSDPAAFTFDLTSRAAWFVADGTPTNDVVLVVDNANKGAATGLAAGSATVTAFYDEKSGSTAVTVP
jgi:hypothetical protein